jgi:anti-sigma-K factor RskA
MTSPDIHTLTGAYALDALEEFERRQFQAHLAQCPDCAREVDELRATGAKLGVAVAQQPPDTLRRTVMAQIAVTRQDSPISRPAEPHNATSARTGRAGWRVRLTASAAALAAAAALILGIASVRTGQERDAAQTQLAQIQAQYAPVAQLAAAPDARGSAGAGVRGGTAFVLASHQLDKAVLLVSGLPTPPSGHTYQVWLIGHGHLRSVGLLTVSTSTSAPPLQFGDLSGATKVGLTIEPAGGSPQPSTTPVALFDLPT